MDEARLKLYDYLEKLDRRVLYFDTDSCIFVCNERTNDEEYRPHLGTLLGDMTDELKGPNVHIETFLSGGPKFYAKKQSIHRQEKYADSLKINFDSIKKLIDTFMNGDDAGNIKLYFKAIRRTPKHDVITRDEYKTCCIVLKKRRYHSIEELSLPFGYKR